MSRDGHVDSRARRHDPDRRRRARGARRSPPQSTSKASACRGRGAGSTWWSTDGKAHVELELAAALRGGAAGSRTRGAGECHATFCGTRPGSTSRASTSRSKSSTDDHADGRQARRTALFLLYQWDLTGQPLTALYEGEPDEFALGLAEAVSVRAEELDRRITESAEGWTADRLGTLERNILRIGIHELEEESVPPEVAMNEAVVLAKRYASEDAGRLVNGILAACQQQRGTRGGMSGTADEALGRAEELLERLKATRDELERLADAEDVESAVEVLAELADLAKEVEAELAKARARADAPQRLTSCAALVEGYLAELAFTPELGGLEEALRYPLESGGKRVRPVICLAVERGGRSCRRALPARRRRGRARAHVLARPRRPSGDGRRRRTPRAARRRTSPSTRRLPCSPATPCSPRRSGSRSPTRRRWSGASSRRRRSG